MRGKERTSKAHDGEVKRLTTARAGREAERSVLRRTPCSESAKRTLAAAKLRTRAQWLRKRADRKSTDAQALLDAAATLRAEAAALAAKAEQLENEFLQAGTMH